MNAIKLSSLEEAKQYRPKIYLWLYPLAFVIAMYLIPNNLWSLHVGHIHNDLGYVDQILMSISLCVWLVIVIRFRQGLIEWWRHNVIGYKLWVLVKDIEGELDPTSEDNIHSKKLAGFVVTTTTKDSWFKEGLRNQGEFISLRLSLFSFFGHYLWTRMKYGYCLARFSNLSFTEVDIKDDQGNRLIGLDLLSCCEFYSHDFAEIRWVLKKFSAFHSYFTFNYSRQSKLIGGIVEAIGYLEASKRFMKSKGAGAVRESLEKTLREVLPANHPVLAMIDIPKASGETVSTN